MMKLNLQYFGGRGSSSDGESLASGSGKPVNIISETDVWTYRHNPNNAPYVDSINSSVREMSDDFPSLMRDTVNSVDTVEFGGADKTGTLGIYGDGRVGLNSNYTNIEKMNAVYDKGVQKGYHPGRGNKNAVEAVTYHEMGHALTDNIAQKMGVKNLDASSKRIVEDAYKASGGKGGTKAWAGKISGYAQENFAECVAEAVADYYCNGSKASKQSHNERVEEVFIGGSPWIRE